MSRVTRALYVRDGGALEWGTRTLPEPGPNEIVVDVAATGLNRADLLQRRGLYPAPPDAPPDILGLEYAGVVGARGPGAHRHALGAHVMGIVGGGALAARVVVHEDEAMVVPPHLSLEHAAAVPEAFLTAHDALFVQGDLRASDRVLIHAVTSGIGSAAVQLASAAGAHVIGTTRTAAKLDRLARALEAWEAQTRLRGVVVDGNHFAAGSGEVDLVLDLVGASYFAENLAAIAPRGRWIVVGALGGLRVDLPLGTLLAKRLTLRGTVLRSRSRAEKIAVVASFLRDFGDALATGRVGPIVDHVRPVADVEAAWAAMSANETVGKVVVAW